MDTLLYLTALGLVKFLQSLPLRWVARIGRGCGALAYVLDGRHRRVAQRNLAMCFGQEKSPAELNSIAKENFRRLGENYACAVKTAAMSWDELKDSLELGTLVPGNAAQGDPPQSIVFAVGHFGNFELYARFARLLDGYECATTYRGLRQPSLNRLLQSMRQASSCLFFERRTDAPALRAWMGSTRRILGLLADQHAGTGGIRVPFFGHDCSTTASPAVFALRYNCALRTGICYRVGLARWRLEMGNEIQTREGGRSRSVETITREINEAFEAAVRRDPANWFWVHNRWKPDKLEAKIPKVPPAVVERDVSAAR